MLTHDKKKELYKNRTDLHSEPGPYIVYRFGCLCLSDVYNSALSYVCLTYEVNVFASLNMFLKN